MYKGITFAVALLLFALAFYTPRAEARESTIQRIAQPCTDVAGVVLRVAGRLFASPMSVFGYLTGELIGRSDVYSANILTRTAWNGAMTLLSFLLSVVFFLLSPVPLILLILAYATYFLLSSLFQLLSLCGCGCSICGIILPPWILDLPLMLFLLGISILLYVILMLVGFAFGSVLFISLILVGVILTPLNCIGACLSFPFFAVIHLVYEFLGFRPIFKIFSPYIVDIINLLTSIVAHLPISNYAWHKCYNGLLRGSSISPFVRNYFEFVGKNIWARYPQF